jgi:serine/threonine-protein kinase
MADQPSLPDLPSDAVARPFGESVFTKLHVGDGAISCVCLRGPDGQDATRAAAGAARYQLLGEIGRGGIGAVLKGRDLDLGRDLAVKILLEQHQDNPDLVRRFVEEAQVGGQLQHPGVVPVYELGTFPDRRPFFTMKLVQGRTLAELLAGRKDVGPIANSPAAAEAPCQDAPQDLPRFLSVFEQVCQTLAYAHSRGVIHRDLKPANIMVGAFGEVQVMDWGLAKVLAQGGRPPSADPPAEGSIHTVRSGAHDAESQAGTVLGTPAYMAPEQARGETERLDARCDVFGLGAILCEILTGRPPYAGATVGAKLRQAREGDLAGARQRLDASGADAELVRLAGRCLAPDPADRPRDAAAVVAELAAHLASVQQRLRAAELETAAARARAAQERKARLLTAALAAAVLAIFLLGGGTWAWLARAQAERMAQTTRDVDQALAEATRLWAQAKAAPVGQLLPWQEARAAAAKARTLLDAGAADEAAVARVAKFLAELAAAEAVARQAAAEADQDRAMLRRLARSRQRGAEVIQGHFDLAGADAAYAQAFQEYGIDVQALGTAEAAARVRRRAIRDQLVAALDYWGNLRSRPADRRRLYAVAKAADPDGWRDRLRDTVAEQDWPALRRLAAEAPVERLPAPALALIGGLLSALKDPLAVPFLQRARKLHPDDFWINHELAWAFEDLRPPRWEEAVRYYTASVALSPASPGAYLNLAHALHGRGDPDGAIAALEEAIRLKPDYAEAHDALGLRRERKGDYTGAAAAYRKAIHLRPAQGKYHLYLGMVLEAQKDRVGAEAAYHEAARLLPNPATAQFNLGNLFLRAGAYDRALGAYREALNHQPDLAVAHLNSGAAWVRKGDLGRAVAAFREALRHDPDLAAAHENLARTLLDQKDEDGALTALREFARRQPDNVKAHNLLVPLLNKQGLHAEAARSYAALVRLRPDDLPARFALGKTLVETGDLEGARAAFRVLLRRRPDDAAAQVNFAAVLWRQGDNDGAVAALREAVRVKPDHAFAQSRLGILLTQKGRFAEALGPLQEARRLRPEDAVTHFTLGEVLEAKPDLAGSAEAYGEAARLDPKDARAPSRQGRVLARLGRLPEAAVAYAAAVRLDPNDAQTHTDLGRVLGPLGKLDEALTAFRKAVALKPDLAEAHQGQGLTLSGKGAHDEAVAAFEKALRLRPGFPEALTGLAGALAERGELAGALAALGEALRSRPENAKIHYALGNVLRDLGKLDEAARAFREAVRLQPAYAEAHCNLGQVLQYQGKLAEALAELKRGHALGTKDPHWTYPSRRWVAACERLIALDRNLPAVLRGEAAPASPAERLELALLCMRRDKDTVAAAQFFDGALADAPKLVAGVEQGLRYQAACAAARAGVGHGDADGLDDKERGRWRQRARDWLQADLAGWAKLLEDKEAARPAARRALTLWLKSPALAGLRDPVACGNLPAAERADCRRLWADVAALLGRAAPDRPASR